MNTLLRAFAISLCALLPMAASSSAEAATFGRTSVGTIPSGGLRADFKRGSKFVLSEKAVATKVCGYLDGNGGGTSSQGIEYVLYRDQNGLPGSKVISTYGLHELQAATQPGWFCLPTYSPVWLEPGTYWIMIHTGGNAGVIRYYYDGPANWYGNADEFDDSASDPFGAGTAGEGTLSLYVDVTPTRTAGTTTIGTRVSSPMSANQKRGSSFTLTEKARLWGLSAYIDGLGGVSGSQPLSIALYDDLNGEPAVRIASGAVNAAALAAGSAPHWVDVGMGGTLLMPGKYWIVLQTAGPAGVLRYYMEGTGNWRGNANTGTEPSVFFGAANSGDGTITANISYTPENVLQHRFGQTTPGTVASSGLTANFVRGSALYPDHYFGEGWVTGLWAYMDGYGGAAGSQKVRLALYKQTTPDYYAIAPLVVSDEVTIPAGKAPGWVRFPVPRTRIYNSEYEYYGTMQVLMFSGETQGVARYYLSTDADNWYGGPADYGNVINFPPYYRIDDPNEQGALVRGTRTMSTYVEFLNTAETDFED